MRSRRQFIRLSLLALLAPNAGLALRRAQPQSAQELWLPLLIASDVARPDDLPLLARASGTVAQAVAWLAARCATEYTRDDVALIVEAYQRLGDSAGMDWFLAIAQMAHETGHMTSWWSGRPRRNPAGLGVTGETQPGLADGTPGPAPGPHWAWDDTTLRWRAGISFPSWEDYAIPAHLGRLLAYALTDDQASEMQRALIDYALMWRPLPAHYRGAAPTIVGLNGRWAVPGTEYGQRIIDLAWRMRTG